MEKNKMMIVDGKTKKILRSKDYNFDFDKTNGNFMRWGKTTASKDDPQFSPFGPEILDIEISVNGCPNGTSVGNPVIGLDGEPVIGEDGKPVMKKNKSECAFCYKNNTQAKPTNMTLDTFKTILSKMPRTLCQIAFGITGVQTNPDFLDMMWHARNNGIIPNFTLSGKDLTDEMAEKCAKVIGAVAVSAYESDKNVCYNTVKKFTDLGITQTNIHLFTSQENLDFVYEVVNDRLTDPRLANMNAIVFLGVKPKGRAKGHFHSVSTEDYAKLIKYCLDKRINFGFDSCSCSKYELAIADMDCLTEEEKIRYVESSESCESFGLFSSYINAEGSFFPCSFAEGEGDWKEGISVVDCDDFLKDVWFSDKLNKYREQSLSTCYASGCRKCLIFDEINPKIECEVMV